MIVTSRVSRCDVIVHIFKKEFREIYELEKLWGDAEIINIQ